jgi:iron(III) transport system permease protein
MGVWIRRILRAQNPWIWASAFFTGLVILPLLFVLSRVFEGGLSALISSLLEPTVGRYLANTALLLVGVGCLSFLVGVGTAWLITMYEFPGRRWLGGMLFLPLVMPAYILAYTYAGLFEVTGIVESALRALWGTPQGRGRLVPFEIMSLWGLISLLALNLYPYVLMTTRAAFARQSAQAWEVARSLGVSPWRAFWQVILPMTRPAWVGGLILCLLEVINDYGAAEFYGVDTFATAIFRQWFARDNAAMAIRLAACLMLVVFLLLLLERWQRGQARYDEGGGSFRPILREKLNGWRAWSATLLCLFPILLGFVIPVMQLALWAYHAGRRGLGERFWVLLGNSLWLASVAAALTVLVALLIAYTLRVFDGLWLRRMARLALIGYSIPGTVIAVGVLVVAASVDRLWMRLGITSGMLLSGSALLMLIAFLVRFLMVAYAPIEGGFQKNGRHLNDASRLLGHPPLKTLWRVELPLLRSALLGAYLLVFIDALKELPLTLFLRWGNFNTLSTEIYNLAKQMEVVEDAGAYALLLVLAGLLPVLGLERLLSSRQGDSTSLSTYSLSDSGGAAPKPPFDADSGGSAPKPPFDTDSGGAAPKPPQGSEPP